MGVEAAVAERQVSTSTNVTCVCGERVAAKVCHACALRYCNKCSAWRHRHGALSRHVLEDLTDTNTTSSINNNACERETNESDTSVAVGKPNVKCDECDDRHATISCEACELQYCATCHAIVHRHGNLQTHIQTEDVGQEPDERRVAQVVDKLLQDDGTVVASPRLFGQEDADPDQELSPTPPTKASPPSDASTASSSYDLWGSWSVRSFSGDRASLSSPPPLSGPADWRAFRSLSIDESPASPPLSLHEDQDDTTVASLSAIATSLQSMSFASSTVTTDRPVSKRTPRPRSFSDYTSLGSAKLNDIWYEHVPQLEMPPPKRSVGDELYRSMKTTVASRHVIIRTLAGGFTSSSLRRVIDTLSTYGPIASIREEFTGDGVLFCTFFQLKAAIGAVRLWFTNKSRTGTSETTAFFSVPYEMPNDINLATLLVQIHGPPYMGAFSDMRQLCSRYGEVASILERDVDDTGASPFLVEYNDSRDIVTALSSLGGVLLPSGHMISASRSLPPTFDMTKIQVFQDSVDTVSSQHVPLFPNRPKSYSEGTSILTSPSSTTSSSPLHGSFFETRSSSFRQMSDLDGEFVLERSASESLNESTTNSRSPSPFTPSLSSSGSSWRVRESARPRSSSAFASLPADSSSALLADAFSPPPAHPSRFSHQQSSQYRPLPTAPGFSQQLNAHTLMMQGRLGPIRSGSDPGFRGSYAASTTSSTSSIGRNDQGTGEYSLSIEKVAAGEDKRTTLMVRNIPNKYTQQMLLSEINENHHGKYDFFYLPIDFKNKCNMGYAFINFIEADSIVSFYQEFDSQKWTNFNSEKVCAISYARLQGKQAMITRFQNSSLLEKHESYRPLVFFSSGPNQGKPEPFPSPKPQHHQPAHLHQYPGKKLHHQHHPSQVHQQMLSDEYLLAAQSGRLYTHQQQQLHAAHVLHGHAFLANAHAAAAAMLHNMPSLGMQPTQYTPPRPVHYGHTYQQHLPADRRQGQSQMNVAPPRTPTYSAFGSFSGTSYPSSSTQS